MYHYGTHFAFFHISISDDQVLHQSEEKMVIIQYPHFNVPFTQSGFLSLSGRTDSNVREYLI